MAETYLYSQLFSCTLRIASWIIKKRSEKKREKSSSERRRLVEELHAAVRRNFLRRRIIVYGLWQADVLKCVRTQASTEVITTYLPPSMWWASTYGPYQFKSKSGSEAAHAIAKIIRKSPKNLQTDTEKEFYNADVQKKHNVNHIPGLQVWNDDLRNRWRTNAVWSTKI